MQKFLACCTRGQNNKQYFSYSERFYFACPNPIHHCLEILSTNVWKFYPPMSGNPIHQCPLTNILFRCSKLNNAADGKFIFKLLQKISSNIFVLTQLRQIILRQSRTNTIFTNKCNANRNKTNGLSLADFSRLQLSLADFNIST